jgi:lysophospholipase L1-like esterase
MPVRSSGFLRPPPWRRALLVAAAAAALAGAVHYLWFNRGMGSGPAGPEVPREPFARTWSDRPVLLLGLGDSVTAGFGASPGLSYFDRLAVNPPGEFPEMQGVCLQAVLPNLRRRNDSVSGSTSLDHESRQIPSVERFPAGLPGVVVFTTGGNDIIHDYGRSPAREGAMFGATLAQAGPWIRNFETRLDRMIAALRTRFPGGMDLFLANIYDPTDGVGTAGTVGLPAWPDGLRIHAAYNGALAAAATRHPDVHLVDIHTPLLGHGIYCRQFWRPHYRREDPTHWFFENFEDPNDRGYDAIRRAFLREMARVLPERLAR